MSTNYRFIGDVRSRDCKVYWGSHGCQHLVGHDGPHECSCCECDDHERDHDDEGCVAKPPYYSPEVQTLFYGWDAERLGLVEEDK